VAWSSPIWFDWIFCHAAYGAQA